MAGYRIADGFPGDARKRLDSALEEILVEAERGLPAAGAAVLRGLPRLSLEAALDLPPPLLLAWVGLHRAVLAQAGIDCPEIGAVLRDAMPACGDRPTGRIEKA